MITTIVLLSGFQVYWLNKLYEEEYTSIKRDTNIIFRDCLYNLQVDRFKRDTSLKGLPRGNLFTSNLVNMLKSDNSDSAAIAGSIAGGIAGAKKGRIFISINSHVDSMITDGVRSMATDRVPRQDTSFEKIIYKRSGDHDMIESFKTTAMLCDSLPLSTVDSAYKRSLSDAKINLPFKIVKINLKKDNGNCEGAFCTSIIPMGIFGLVGYRASFDKPLFRLIKSISPQILLSLFLVGLTLVSFIFIYRNLLQQKRLSEIKNEFISNITHELKTPISTVSVAIEAIKNFNASNDPDRTAEYLGIAENELQRLTMLVDKVLKLSMFEQEQVELRFERFDLSVLMEEVLVSMRLQFEKYKAIVQFNKLDKSFVNADRVHITSVLDNLLENALKYSDVPPHINIAITKKGGDVLLNISDKGKGIAPEFKSKIFDKFFRVPHGDAHDAKGYGLGLSYVKHILNQHKGSIEVESIPGEGSTFTIKLPGA